MNSDAIETIRRLNANVHRTDNEPLTVDISVSVRLDDGEHFVSITWNPHTDEVSLERI